MKSETSRKTTSRVMIVNMWNDTLNNNLSILKLLRLSWIACEIYLDSESKIPKAIEIYKQQKNTICYYLLNWK